MSSTNVARMTVQGPQVPGRGTLGSAANQFFARKTIVTRNAAGRAVSPSTADASGFPALGVANASYDNRTGSVNGGLDDSIDIDIDYGLHGFDISGSTPLPGDVLFVVDNQTLSASSNGDTRGIAGVCSEVRETTPGRLQAFCWFGPLAPHLVEAIDVADLQTDATTANAIMGVPLNGFTAADGTPLTKFASAGTPTFGLSLTDSEILCIRWNNDAAPGAILGQVNLPPDLDDGAPAELEFLCSKTGATVGDATTLTITAFLLAVGDLDDADADAGGVTNALVGNAAAKTTALLSRTIAAADIQPGAYTMTFTVKPTAGTLGTDDLVMTACRLRYKRKLLVA